MKTLKELKTERAGLNQLLPIFGKEEKDADEYNKIVKRISEINEEIHGRTTTRVNGVDFLNGAVESGELEL